MARTKKNYLLEEISNILANEPRGRLLDLGCGDGDYSIRAQEMGFEVTAGDLDNERFRYNGKIRFMNCDVTSTLPFKDGEFDVVVFLEIIEHLRNPYSVVRELCRILKPNGRLILSTPNILSLKSRIRFLFEGNYDYFREPPLDQIKNPKAKIFNLHIVPYRYHELEFLLADGGFRVSKVYTSVREGYAWSFLEPILNVQALLRVRRSRRKGGPDYARIYDTIHSPEVLYGRHLIVKALKNDQP